MGKRAKDCGGATIPRGRAVVVVPPQEATQASSGCGAPNSWATQTLWVPYGAPAKTCE